MTRPFLLHALGGRDILAACGQLKSESERMRKVDRIAFEAMMIAGHGEE